MLEKQAEKEMLDAALRYKKLGWSVIPLQERSKKPAIGEWKDYQEVCALETQIRKWYRDHFLQGIGIVLGKVSGNLVVIDLDGSESVDEFYKAFPLYKEKTFTVMTGSGAGQHLYFYVDKLPEKMTLAPGFEIRTNGGYVAAPPSIHPSGKQYDVIHRAPVLHIDNLNDIQKWIESKKKSKLQTSQAENYSERLKNADARKRAYVTKAQEGECETIRAAVKGSRNKTLNESAFKLGQLVHVSAVSEGEIFHALFTAAKSNTDDTESQLRKTIQSGLDAGKQKPRPLPEPVQDTQNAKEKRAYKPTDDVLGDRFIERYGKQYSYFYEDWRRYENGIWKIDPRIRLHLWNILKEAKSEGVRPNSGVVSSVENYSRLHLLIDDEKVDNAQNYINLENGLFNLDSFKLEAHKPELYMTSQLPFSYEENASAEVWQKFLNDVVPDTKMQLVLRQAIGYSLTSSTNHRLSFWLVGQSGTGKSTLLNVIIALAGESHVTIDLNELSNNSYQLADVAGKRVVTFTEPDSNSVLADGHYKRLVSNDVITARHPYGRPFRFVPIAKVWGAMNDTPRVLDRSNAVYGRVMIFPMQNVMPTEQWDMQLGEKLKAELPGIFNWALVGLKRLIRAGQFEKCKLIEDARREYREENDSEAAFVADWLKVGEGHSIGSQRLYQAYKSWCELNGIRPKGSRKIRKEWKRLGFTFKRSHISLWQGCNLNEIAEKFC